MNTFLPFAVFWEQLYIKALIIINYRKLKCKAWSLYSILNQFFSDCKILYFSKLKFLNTNSLCDILEIPGEFHVIILSITSPEGFLKLHIYRRLVRNTYFLSLSGLHPFRRSKMSCESRTCPTENEQTGNQCLIQL